jgi:adhesin/invasin
MVARCRRLSVAGLALLALVVTACEKVPLLAPVGSTITLTASSNVVTANQSVDIVAQVMEASGSPPHSGTTVTFVTTLGTISPVTATTDTSGRATARFLPGTANGTATIGATSGGATTGTNGAIRISIGTAAVGAVRVGANPASVPAQGGATTITATVLDVNGNALTSVPVVFATTAGVLSSSIVTTDGGGGAQTVLTTSQQATVTASVGAQGGSSTGSGGTSTGTGGGTTTPTTPTTPTSGQASGTVTVTVNTAPTLVITPPTTAPAAGIPAQFTFAVTAASTGGSAVRSLRVNWGDGSSQELGAVSGNAVAQHTYRDTGSYIVTATLTDASGNVTTVSTAVNVIPVASPTIIITPSVPSSCTGAGACQVSFQLQVTPPTGVGIVSVTVNFGATATPPEQGLGGLTGSATLSARYPAGAGVQTVTVTVVDTLGRTTQGFTTINIP